MHLQHSAFQVQIVHREPAEFTGPQSGFRCEPVERAVRFSRCRHDLLDLLLGCEEPLPPLRTGENNAFHDVMSDVAPGFRCGPHALEGDANVSRGLRGNRRPGDEMLDKLGIHILHGMPPEKTVRGASECVCGS